MSGRTNVLASGTTRSTLSFHVPLALLALSLFSAYLHAANTATSVSASDYQPAKAPALSATLDAREPLSALKDPPARKTIKKHDQVSPKADAPNSGEHFPDTAVGRALHKHLLILVDVSEGADARKDKSLEELRKNAKETNAALLSAYKKADPADYFGRWLISLTMWELKTDESYAALRDIAKSEIPAGLKDNDLAGSARSNESAIRQNATAGLAQLAHAGNAAAEKDLLSLALAPPSGDDAVRTVAIKGYLAAGRDYDARVRTLMAQLPKRYDDVVTLAVSPPEPVAAPGNSAIKTRNGG